MFWWLFWGELVHRCLAPRPLRLQHSVQGNVAHRVRPRRRPAREASVPPMKAAAVPRRPILRLVCVDGVRIDRAAS